MHVCRITDNTLSGRLVSHSYNYAAFTRMYFRFSYSFAKLFSSAEVYTASEKKGTDGRPTI